MFSELRLVNLKAFEHANVEFKPLTFFLGPNNSGKSSVLAPYRLLAQTIASYDSGIALLLNGLMGDFGTYRDLVFGNDRRRDFEIWISTKYSRSRRRFLGRYLKENDELGIRLGYTYRSRRREIVLKTVNILRNGESILSTKYSDKSERQLVDRISGKHLPGLMGSTFSRRAIFQNFLPRFPIGLVHLRQREVKGVTDSILKEVEFSLRTSNYIGIEFNEKFRSIEYIGAMRIPPQRTYQYRGESRESVGASGEFASSIMVMDSLRRGTRSRKILENVRQWLRTASLSSDLKIVSLSDRHYEMHVKHPATKEYENFADVGYGISQILPVLVAGYNLTPGATFISEEPEIHLHPRAQAELGNFFMKLYQKEVQSFVETHSEHLILRMQQHVASGKIKSDDIAFYYVYPKRGKKVVVRLDLDEKGKFIEKWPEGFFPERLEEARRLSRIRNS